MPLSPSMSWLAIGLGLFVLWQIVKRLPWEEVSQGDNAGSGRDSREAIESRTKPQTVETPWLTSLRAGERGQAGAPSDWDEAA